MNALPHMRCINVNVLHAAAAQRHRHAYRCSHRTSFQSHFATCMRLPTGGMVLRMRACRLQACRLWACKLPAYAACPLAAQYFSSFEDFRGPVADGGGRLRRLAAAARPADPMAAGDASAALDGGAFWRLRNAPLIGSCRTTPFRTLWHDLDRFDAAEAFKAASAFGTGSAANRQHATPATVNMLQTCDEPCTAWRCRRRRPASLGCGPHRRFAGAVRRRAGRGACGGAGQAGRRRPAGLQTSPASGSALEVCAMCDGFVCSALVLACVSRSFCRGLPSPGSGAWQLGHGLVVLQAAVAAPVGVSVTAAAAAQAHAGASKQFSLGAAELPKPQVRMLHFEFRDESPFLHASFRFGHPCTSLQTVPLSGIICLGFRCHHRASYTQSIHVRPRDAGAL